MYLVTCLSALTIGAGAGVAAMAEHYQQHKVLLQRVGGGLVVAGAALAGLAFPLFV
jgi:hypothetical protein